MRKGVNLGVFALRPVNAAEARKCVLAINVHGARPADTFAAGASERERRVHLVLDLDEGVEDHGTALVQVNLVRLQHGLGTRFVRILRAHHAALATLRFHRAEAKFGEGVARPSLALRTSGEPYECAKYSPSGRS